LTAVLPFLCKKATAALTNAFTDALDRRHGEYRDEADRLGKAHAGQAVNPASFADACASQAARYSERDRTQEQSPLKYRLWTYALLLAVFVVLGWFIGPGRSWHVVHLIVLVLAAMGLAYIVFNIFDGFRELRQRRRDNG
jgi:hypothetical protein